MIFRSPWILFLLPLAVGLTWWRYRLARRPGIPFSHAAALAAIPVGRTVWIRHVGPVLYGVAIAALILALAGPRRGIESFRTETEVVDIALLVDVSTSMRAEDFSDRGQRMNRIDAVKRVAADFIRARPRDRLGLIVFSALPYTMSPLTLDHDFVLARLAESQAGMVEDGTAIGDALASAVNRLRESKARSRVVVLLTDGQNNRGKISPLTAAQAAQAMGIRVYAIGAASEGDAPYPVNDAFGQRRYVRMPSEIDDTELTKLAETTGGKYFRATDYDSLKKVYAEIDAMERTVVDVTHFVRYEERFAPLLVLALALLAVERLIGASRFSVLSGG